MGRRCAELKYVKSFTLQQHVRSGNAENETYEANYVTNCWIRAGLRAELAMFEQSMVQLHDEFHR